MQGTLSCSYHPCQSLYLSPGALCLLHFVLTGLIMFKTTLVVKGVQSVSSKLFYTAVDVSKNAEPVVLIILYMSHNG